LSRSSWWLWSWFPWWLWSWFPWWLWSWTTELSLVWSSLVLGIFW